LGLGAGGRRGKPRRRGDEPRPGSDRYADQYDDPYADQYADGYADRFDPYTGAYPSGPPHSPVRRADRLVDPIGQRPGRAGLPDRGASGRHLEPRHDRRRLGALLFVGAIIVGCAVGIQQFVVHTRDGDTAGGVIEDPLIPPSADSSDSTTPEPTQPATPPNASGFATPGLLTFRGSATRSYYGEGPVPADPEVLWSYPGSSGGMCAESSEGGETRTWCGSGWTGQPAVFERDGRRWVVFGAYDRKVHFVDYDTGEDILPPFETGDIIKGSVSIDPDGLPLVYTGSRDNQLRVIAIDRPTATELWSLSADAVSPTKWNNDWDASPLILDDYLYEGGENSQFHIVKLNRTTGDDGLVQVAPELVFNAPGWDDELTAALNTRQNDVSIENSVAYHDGVIYFANSGGLVQGWDVSRLAEGVEPSRVFRFWTGDDTDASVVIDDEGFLYVAVENERANARAAEVGQLIKLDPRKPDTPLVWSVADPGGFWATPALHRDVVIAPSDGGTVYAIDRQSGEVRWTFELPPPTWQSPVIIDDTLIQGDCNGVLHAYDVSDTAAAPPELWSVQLEGCIESTPAVWQGRIFVGARGGRFYAVGDP
jgi:outer membrane protein assembly factor BamB